jgi:hypothetical protein
LYTQVYIINWSSYRRIAMDRDGVVHMSSRTAAILAAAALASPALAFVPVGGPPQHQRGALIPALNGCSGGQRRLAVHCTAVHMTGAGKEDGLRMIQVGKRGDMNALGPNNGMPSNTITKSDKPPQPNKAVLDALAVSSWWKHDAKHRTVVNGDELAVDYNQMLGDGTYGEVFMAEFTAGKYKGKKAVVKRAKDGMQDPLDPATFSKVNSPGT